MSTPGPFEQWARSEGLISESHGVRFVNSQCDVAQKAWQASRAEAFEEAAKEMDLMNEHHDADNTYAHAAACIRALAEADGENPC